MRESFGNLVFWLRLFPFLRQWPRVSAKTLRADASAGLTGAVVVLPQGVAFATIAGMPPEYGLYAAMVPAIVAALFGSSWHLVSGPTTAASILLYSVLSGLAEPGSADYVRLALTLTFMVGVIELVLGLARMGFLVNFISHSVIVGFTAGAGVLIAANQLKHFFGIEMPRGLHLHETLLEFARQIGDINPYVTGVGVATIALGLLCKRYWKAFPYMIAAMVGGSLISVALNLILGKDMTGIETVGALPATLPPLSSPDFSLATIKQLAPAALAATLFALTEAVSIARAMSAKSGQLLNGNREFVGQGLSNIAGSFFSAYVATGSFNRSGVNYAAGARSPLAALIAGAALVLLVLVVAPLAAYLPNAAMAGILFVVAWGLIDFHHIHKISQASRSEAVVMWSTLLATLFLELEFAILLGVFLSLLVYLSRTSRPRVVLRVPDARDPKRRFTTDARLPDCPQLSMVRIEGSLFFGAVNYVAERLRLIAKRNRAQVHLLLLARSINFVDVAGAEMLVREAEDRRRRGGGLYLCGLKPGAADTLERGGYIEEIGRDRLFMHKNEAVSAIFARLDHSICSRCSKRIFTECQTVPRAGQQSVSSAARRSGSQDETRSQAADTPES